MKTRDYLFSCLILVLGLTYANSQPAQTVSTTNKFQEKVYSSYSASFYSAVQLQALLQKSGHANDMEYDRSLYLLRSVPESKYRTKQYADFRMQYDKLAAEENIVQTSATQVQNELNQFVNNRMNNRQPRNGNNQNNTYEAQKQNYYNEINKYQSQYNNLRAQQQKIYNQMLTEQLSMYSKALGDELFLKKMLEDYAMAGIKKIKQEKNNQAQLKARQEEQQAAVDWQAWVTFEYISKYSTLDARLEKKEITYTEYEKQRDKLDKEKIDKFKLSRREAREAFEETYKRLTTAHDTTVRVPDF
jgi:DNA-binding protein